MTLRSSAISRRRGRGSRAGASTTTRIAKGGQNHTHRGAHRRGFGPPAQRRQGGRASRNEAGAHEPASGSARSARRPATTSGSPAGWSVWRASTGRRARAGTVSRHLRAGTIARGSASRGLRAKFSRPLPVLYGRLDGPCQPARVCQCYSTWRRVGSTTFVTGGGFHLPVSASLLGA